MEEPDRAKNLEMALDNLTRALELNQRYFDAWLLKGSILTSLERFGEALNAYLDADRIESNSDTLAGKATSFFKLKRYSDAATVADELLKLDPNDLFALNLKGKSYYLLGKLPEAKAVFEAALQIYPGNPNLLYNLGEVQLALSNSTDSRNESKELIKISLNLGLENEDPASASDAKEILRDISPDDFAIIYYNEAFNLEKDAESLNGSNKIKTLENALDSISMAVGSDPEYFDALLLKGEILLALDRYSEALAAYDEADRIERNVDTMTGKTKSLYFLKRYSETVSASDELLELNQNDVFALNAKGKSYYMMGKIPEAYEVYNQSLSVFPENPSLLYNMGLVQLALGKIPEAKASLNLALESGLMEANPDFAEDAERKIHDLG